MSDPSPVTVIATATKAWLDSQPEIVAIAAIGTAYGPVISMAVGLVTLIKNWNQDDKDNARASKIVREVVSQINDIIQRTEQNIKHYIDTVKDYIDNDTLKQYLYSMKGNDYNLQLWLTTLADSNFANFSETGVVDCLQQSNKDIAGVEGCLLTAIEKKDPVRSLAIYQNLHDAVDLHTRILKIIDKDAPFESNIEIAAKLTLLIDLHPKVQSVVREFLRRQFVGPVRETYDAETGKIYVPPRRGIRSGPPPLVRTGDPPVLVRVFVYYFRGERRAPKVEDGLFKERSADVVKARMEAHLDQVLTDYVGNFLAVQGEQQNALAAIKG
ncbi:hypothetical protein QQS21_002692 [Conoideocrella luteorostrata]|uniref:Uncharacterized protein n=1 Tax=Conoideocrella luteorostrata TaxID=1105319 RepID=A0AAJ0FX00_9HYPO|nr:hypothetical protein QQS21_002692 [Conoideocrella luteorostrata]